MAKLHPHSTHPDLVKRLTRADGYLRHVIEMIRTGAPRPDIALQLQAVKKAPTTARRAIIHGHFDHCFGNADDIAMAEMRALAKLL